MSGVRFEAQPPPDVPRLENPAGSEIIHTIPVSFGDLSGRALSRHLEALTQPVLEQQVDRPAYRLVAVMDMCYRDKLKRALKAGFRVAEINNQAGLFGLEVLPEDTRTQPVRVDTNLKITTTPDIGQNQ
jgi:hypothetical protein